MIQNKSAEVPVELPYRETLEFRPATLAYTLLNDGSGCRFTAFLNFAELRDIKRRKAFQKILEIVKK